MNFWVNKDGQTFGPYSASEVNHHIEEGYFLSTDLISCDGADWVQVLEALPILNVQATGEGGDGSTDLSVPTSLEDLDDITSPVDTEPEASALRDCPDCRSSISQSAKACPQCGRTLQVVSWKAIASLVCGIIPVFPLAIIFGLLAKDEIKESNGSISGSGMALAGLILGLIELVVLFLALLGFVFVTHSLKPKEIMPPIITEGGRPLDIEPSGDEKFYELRDLVCNLGGPVKPKYLDIHLKLKGQAGDFEFILEAREHRIRDKALTILGNYTYEDAQIDGFQNRVRIDLKTGLDSILRKYRYGESDLIHEIEITHFVVMQ